MSGQRLGVAVLYNAPTLERDHPDAVSEADVVEVARTVAGALRSQGCRAWRVRAAPPVQRVVRLLTMGGRTPRRPDVVFNLIEGFGGTSAGATHITALLQVLGLPYTGSPSESLAFCQSKSRTKALLRGFGLPTAPFAVAPPGAPCPGWDVPGPVFIKPDAEDGSLGIDQGSVVVDLESVRDRVARLHAAYGGPALLETYLPGPEFNVGILELPVPEPLPIAEVAYATSPGAWPILTYAAKWSAGSAEDLATPILCPARIDRALADRLGRLAVAAYRATGCRDYARVDLRLDDRGEPMILEVNPNPDIGPTAGWARALCASGRDYAATIAALARQALERSGGPARA